MELIWPILLPALFFIALYLIFPILVLFHLYRYQPKLLSDKRIWLVAIGISWYFYSLAAIAYGIANFKSKLTKSLAILMAISTVVYACYPADSHYQHIARLKIADAYFWVMRLPPSEQKNELKTDLLTLNDEVMRKTTTIEYREKAAQLGIYLMDAIKGGMTNAELQEWRSIFYYRNQFGAEYVSGLIQARGFNSPDRAVVLHIPGEPPLSNQAPDTLIAEQITFRMPSIFSIFHYLVVTSIILMVFGWWRAGSIFLKIATVFLALLLISAVIGLTHSLFG